jgi:hypothetical protein
MRDYPTGDAGIESRRPTRAGMPVLEASGARVGNVGNPTQQDGYLIVEEGWFFTKRAYIPISAMARPDVHGILLNLSKDELSDPRYTTPPPETEGVRNAPEIAPDANLDRWSEVL